jgi:CRP-like cAMP-binding protein
MKRRSATTTLAGVAPFDRFSPRDLAPLHEHVDRLQVAEGTTLAEPGTAVHQFLVVLAGEVRSVRDDEVVVHGPGSELGGDELLSGVPHPSALVAGPDLELLVVYGPAYRWAVQSLTGLRAA